MWGIVLKIWFFIVVMPYILISEGYLKIKSFFAKRGYEPAWAYTLIFFLLIILIIMLLLGYGY